MKNMHVLIVLFVISTASLCAMDNVPHEGAEKKSEESAVAGTTWWHIANKSQQEVELFVHGKEGEPTEESEDFLIDAAVVHASLKPASSLILRIDTKVKEWWNSRHVIVSLGSGPHPHLICMKKQIHIESLETLMKSEMYPILNITEAHMNEADGESEAANDNNK